MDQLPRLGKRELICLLLFTCNIVVSVWRGFLFLWVLGMGYVILLWHSLSLPLIILIWVLTAQVPDLCILLAFSGQFLRRFVFLFTLLLLYLT